MFFVCLFEMGSGSTTRFVLLFLLLSPNMLFNHISTVSLVVPISDTAVWPIDDRTWYVCS